MRFFKIWIWECADRWHLKIATATTTTHNQRQCNISLFLLSDDISGNSYRPWNKKNGTNTTGTRNARNGKGSTKVITAGMRYNHTYVVCLLSLRQALRNPSFLSMGELGEQIFIAHFESVALARASANNSISTLNSFTDLSSPSYSHWMTYNNRYSHKILLRDACPV
jgi:hypothetical protein